MRQTVSLFLMTLLAAAAPAFAFQATTPAAAPSPVRIGGQTKAPERLKYVAPVYPQAAIAGQVSGTVIIEATIGKDGSVTDAHVLRSIAQLDQAALNAVKQWKYTPTTLNGVPVPVIMTVTVAFTPPGVETSTAPAGRAVAPAATPTPQGGDAPAAARAVDPGIDRTDANIKLVIKVTDTGSPAQAKVATMMLANMGNGRLRSTGNRGNAIVNADAYVELRKSGLVRVNLTVGYTPEADAQTPQFDVSQTISLFLKDGVPTVMTQAADPTKSGRSVTIEVTASIVK
jgi:TonB family protein